MNADRLGVGERARTYTYIHEQQNGGRGGQIKQSLSLLTLVTQIYMHTHGQKDGGWRAATTCLTHRLSAAVTPTTADLSPSPAPARFPLFLALEAF